MGTPVPKDDMPDNIVPDDDLPDNIVNSSAVNSTPYDATPKKASPNWFTKVSDALGFGDSRGMAQASPTTRGYINSGGSPFGANGSIAPLQYDAKTQTVQQTGVDTSGGPYGMRTHMDWGTDDPSRIAAVKQYMDQNGMKAPDGIEPVRKGPDSDQIEYYNPETKRYTTVNAMGGGQGVIPQLPTPKDTAIGLAEGAAMSLAPEADSVLGAAGYAGLTSGIARTTIEAGQRAINNYFGRSDKNLDTVLKESSWEGTKEGAQNFAGAALPAIGGLGQYLRYGPNLFSAEAFKKSFWPKMEANMAASQADIDAFHEIAGQVLKPDAVQMANHQAANVSMGKAFALDENKVRASEAAAENMTALGQFVKDITDKYTGPNAPPVGGSGDDIAAWQRARQEAGQNQANLIRDVAKDNAKQAVDGLPQMSRDDVVKAGSAQVQNLSDQQKEVVDKAWGDWNVKMGRDPQVAYTKDANFLNAPKGPATSFQLSDQGVTRLQNLLDDAQRLKDSDSVLYKAKMAAIPDGFLYKNPQNKFQTAEPKWQIDNSPKDISDVVDLIKAMRAGARKDAQASGGMINADSADTLKVIQTLREDVGATLRQRDPSALAALEEAEQQTKLYGDRFHDSVLHEAVQKADGFNAKVYSQSVSNAIYQSGKDKPQAAIKELRQLANQDPSIGETVRGGLLSEYRANYLGPDGNPTPKLHQQFLDDFAGPIREFFDPVAQARIQHVGNLGDEVMKASEAADKFKRTWNASPFGKLGNVNTVTIANAAFSNAKSVQGIGSFLRANNPALATQLQADTARQFASRIFGPNGFNQAELEKWLAPGKSRQLRDIMGDEYVDNMQRFARAARVITGYGRNATAQSSDEESLIHPLVKLFTGAFGKEARTYNLVRKWREKGAARMMYNIMSDPQKLKQFMALKDQAPSVARKAGFLTAVGGDSVFDDTN